VIPFQTDAQMGFMDLFRFHDVHDDDDDDDDDDE
jgi:hypothetical protein